MDQAGSTGGSHVRFFPPKSFTMDVHQMRSTQNRGNVAGRFK
ncbi:hypothetical protein THTE_4052 [Thermogutta terrifontis]|uniref:Uncharacterized protein n=1 Tax=Thermogutta terrifontis TaxID=1331910 RepID=A0A286RL16_9BACT|nr:hypothetical protein THTE_4052 [Thermogutta terrifontis]